MRHPFSFGHLVREDNQALDKTIIYSYNWVGNTSGAKTYPYTIGAVCGSPVSEDTYNYYSLIPDRISKFNGNSITHDNLGRPTSYASPDGTIAYSWLRDKLAAVTGTAKTTFTYDGRGRRIKKRYENIWENDCL